MKNIPDFTPTKWSSNEDKKKFAARFIRFVESGFKQSIFTKAFYQRLSNCRGHIAHFNQLGFWEEWFANPESQRRFLERWASQPIYGDADYTFSDVERFLKGWIQESGAMDKVTNEANGFVLEAKKTTIKRLYAALPDNEKAEVLSGLK